MSTIANKQNRVFAFNSFLSILAVFSKCSHSLTKVLHSLFLIKKSQIRNIPVKCLPVLTILLSSILFTPVTVSAAKLGGVDLGNLTNYLFYFGDSSTEVYWRSPGMGFLGDVAVDGLQANETTSGDFPYSGTIYTNDSNVSGWQNILDYNALQTSVVTGEATRLTGLETDLVSAFTQINTLTATSGYSNSSFSSLDGLNIQNGTAETYVINITSELASTDSPIITGDADDIFILRWDEDGNPANGYQGLVELSSSGGVIPAGDLSVSNFINVAGNIASKGGGGTPPPPPYPQGPRDESTGALITNGLDFISGGFFTGYWLTTGSPDNYDAGTGLYTGVSSRMSHGFFVGGWYTLATELEVASSSGGVHVSPPSNNNVYTTIADGNWTSASTWLGGNVPDQFLAGDTVNINHIIDYNAGDDLYIESGTLNVTSILDIPNNNIKMENSSGVVNINSGLIILGNSFENLSGEVNFSSGAVQLCNGGFSNQSSLGTQGTGYIFGLAGDIEDTTSSNFSSNIAWCAIAGNGINLPTAENCGVAQPPGGCTDITHYKNLPSPPTPSSLCLSHTTNITFNSLDSNLLYSASGQNFPSSISYIGTNGSNIWDINVKGSSADFDPKTRLTSTINNSGALWENPVWPNANGIFFDGVAPNELIDFDFSFTRVSGSDPLDIITHTGESLDDEIDTLVTDGSDWILGLYGNMTEAPNVLGKTSIFEDNGIVDGVDTGIGYWEVGTSFAGNSGVISWNYDNTDSDMSFKSANMVSFDTCSIAGSSISGNVFKDANNNDAFDSGESGVANISVWLQAINADGSIDPVKLFANTDALGNYELSNLVDGDYQVHVDTTDTDLPGDHILGGANPLIITINGSSVSNADFPFDEVVCTVFSGEVSEVAMPISSQLKTSDTLFVPSKSISPIEGHLRAYAMDSDGKPTATVAWDAADQMTTASRTDNLYSTDAGGKKKSFESLDDAAFGSSALTVATIKEFTLNPSAGGGIYLAGRENGSYLGGISKGNNLDLLTNKLNTSLYLQNTSYRDYYVKTVSIRSERVLMNSDDGFLYAFDYSTGDLVWGWMPRSLVAQLASYTSFQNKHLMAGTVEVLDLPDDKGNYSTYVVGSYNHGLGHYVLKLKDDGTLDKVVWDDDQSSAFVSSPNNGTMEFFSDINGQVYAAYSLTNSVGTSRFKIRNLVDDTVDMNVDLNYEVTSTPFVMQDYGKSNAPDKKTLYLGTSVGDIHSAGLLDSSGSLASTASIKAESESSSVAEMYVVDTEAVTHIDSSISVKDNRYYLLTQTDKRITAHQYKSTTGSWTRKWTSTLSSAGDWDSNGVYTEDSGGIATGIQSLPVGTTITDRAVIVGDAVVLPISVLDTSSTACYGEAFYYLFSLSDGNFPKRSFTNLSNNTAISTNITLGYGEARALSFTDVAGSNNALVGYGIAEKNVDLKAGIATSFSIKDPVSSGVRAWKEVGR